MRVPAVEFTIEPGVAATLGSPQARKEAPAA
jgi:hypothetical protein